MIRFRTLGSVRLENGGGDEAAAVLAQPKRLALLLYLAIARPRGPHRRDTLLGMFWPELDQAHARHALSQSLHFLRRCLGPDVIVSRTEDVALNVEHACCDVLEFDQAVASGDRARALQLYEGDFLDGFHVGDAPAFDQWADRERTRLRAAAVEAAHAAAEHATSGDRPAEAVRWTSRALALDPTNERALRRLMRARDAAGDRAGALRDYRDFTARLAQELDAEPSPETQRLAAAVKARSEASPLESGDFTRFRNTPRAVPAPVLEEDPGTPRAADAADAAGAVPPHRPYLAGRLTARAALAAMVLLGTATVAISYAGDADPATSLVVLPFADMGAGRDDEYLADGLTEDLTAILSTIPQLAVAARTSAYAFKARNVDVREIGRTLNVTSALEGSIRRERDSLRVTAQLIDTRSGYHIWSGAWHVPVDAIFAVQREIITAVARTLGRSPPDADSWRPGDAANVAAYDAYLRGRYLLRQRTRARTLGAIEEFQRAVALDSGYARGYAGLADAYTVFAEFLPPRSILPLARAAAERALRLDSTRVETRLAMADLHLIHDHDWGAAEREFRAALRLDPRSAVAHERYARFLAAARRFDAHIAETRRALELRREQPGDAMEAEVREHMALAAAYFAAHRFDEALRHGLEAAKLDPSAWAAKAVLGRTYIELGRYAEAIAALDQAWPASQQLPALARLGYAYGRAGRLDDARRVLAELEARADTSYVPRDQIALVQLGLGDRESAIASLWRAYEERHWWLPWINQSPPFDALRSDERYRRLLREMGAP